MLTAIVELLLSKYRPWFTSWQREEEGRGRKGERRGWDWLLKREEEKEQEEVEEGPRKESYKD